jgi:hypothetical protein
MRPEDTPYPIELPPREDLNSVLAKLPPGPEFMGDARPPAGAAAMALYAFFHWVFRGYQSIVSSQQRGAQPNA